MKQSKNSTQKIAIPKTADGCSVAVTASIGMASVMNFIDTSHYPKGGVFNHQENLMCDKIIKLANLKIKGRIEQQTRVYSTKGISPTLNSAMGHGGNCIPLFLIVKYKNDNISKEIIHTAPNGKKYSSQIRKYTPRDCFRLMGVHEADIDKLLSKEKSGQLIICKSKLYALAGNSIVTNCLTAMFEELIFPSGKHYHDKSGQLSLF